VTDFESIYEKYFQDVFVYIKALASNEHIAEEITSETFFKAMNAIDDFNGKCDIRVWLCQIAKNSFISYLRKNKNIVQDDLLEEMPDDSDLEQSLINTEMSYVIHEILHQLPEPYKEVFTLRVLGELSFKQIANVFQKTENWACITFHRAKSKIKERLEELQ
jgi:RNA polymerase sigma-70 factor (ECF subfamily)